MVSLSGLDPVSAVVPLQPDGLSIAGNKVVDVDNGWLEFFESGTAILY